MTETILTNARLVLRDAVVQGTIVVLVACGVIGLFLYFADLGLKPLVRDVFLNS